MPDDVLWLTAGVDVHDQALFVEVVGWGKGMESWGILTGSFSGDPRNPQLGVWEKLDQTTVNRLFRYSDESLIRVRVTCVDREAMPRRRFTRIRADISPVSFQSRASVAKAKGSSSAAASGKRRPELFF